MNAINVAGVFVVGAGLLMSQRPANATINQYNHFSNPARACLLSIPTTDTKIRSKASGYRNEGTSNQFVICGLDNLAFQAQTVLSFGIGLMSMDGVAHEVSCTGVVGVSGVYALQYSTATVSVPATNWTQKDWGATSFGGSSGAKITGSLDPSITCTLPPQVAIIYVYEYSDLDIGS